MTDEQLRFPIGKFVKTPNPSKEFLNQCISILEEFPAKIRLETGDLNDTQLDTRYRDGGWTIRQVVHHIADSHVNSLVRFKLTLTEDKPIVKPYFEDRWAELADSKFMPVEPALQMIEGIHKRWVYLLKSMSESDFSKSFIHPEHGSEVILSDVIQLYAWHSEHHLAHITTLKRSKQW